MRFRHILRRSEAVAHVHCHHGSHAGSRDRSQFCDFSVLEGVLLKPLPYPDPDRLIVVTTRRPVSA